MCPRRRHRAAAACRERPAPSRRSTGPPWRSRRAGRPKSSHRPVDGPPPAVARRRRPPPSADQSRSASRRAARRAARAAWRRRPAQLELAERPRERSRRRRPPRDLRDGLPRRERRARQRRRRGGAGGGGALAVRLGARHLHLRRLRRVGLGEHQREDRAQHAEAAGDEAPPFCAARIAAASSAAAVFRPWPRPRGGLRGGRRGGGAAADGAAAGAVLLQCSSGSIGVIARTRASRAERRDGAQGREPTREREGERCGRRWRHRAVARWRFRSSTLASSCDCEGCLDRRMQALLARRRAAEHAANDSVFTVTLLE